MLFRSVFMCFLDHIVLVFCDLDFDAWFPFGTLSCHFDCFDFLRLYPKCVHEGWGVALPVVWQCWWLAHAVGDFLGVLPGIAPLHVGACRSECGQVVALP